MGRNSFFNKEKGQAVVEFAIVFPLQLFLTLLIIQFAFIGVAHVVVNYAAYCAARAEMVGEDAEAAAAIICAPIAGTSISPAGPAPMDFDLPGWGSLEGSGAAQQKTHVEVVESRFNDSKRVKVRVVHDLELHFPVVNQIMAAFMAEPVVFEGDTAVAYSRPHVTIIEECTLPKPWLDTE